ncbi:ATPase, T2SS/T4P/T4SS family [Polycladidibacter hongkongensis]|uniref:ATPase, T2SS/T4P/T4SS family n=1 Tax=Polycladidibacter hongkongensis TaxID=1647556 RepID=UPI00083387F9|nr:ATPase, T2SS/T4P/T4SS family [Pseudovibrio hongkongensis]
MSGNLLLNQLLRPLAQHYANPQVVEVRMRAPGRIIIERRGARERLSEVEDAGLTHNKIVQICRALANVAGLQFCEDNHPSVSSILPAGHRFECLVGPSVATGLSLAVRCKHPHAISLHDMGLDDEHIAYIERALEQQWNIVISGSTNTGKTTLLNNLLSFLPDERRVVSAEDTPELSVERFWNGTALIASRDAAQGAGLRTWQQLYDHKMRISPDNILFGEISTQNAFAALNVLNTGARGWMCTVHAESPQMVPARFQANIDASGQRLEDVASFMGGMVDLVIHIKRDNYGRRGISDMWEMKHNRYVLKDAFH